MVGLEKFAHENKLEESVPDYAESTATNEGLSRQDKLNLLQFDAVISGGKQADTGKLGVFKRLLVGPSDEIRFIRPVAVGGINNYLYVVDAGAQTVFRYDLISQLVEPIGDIGSQFSGEPGNMFVSRDHSFYIVDEMGKQVIQFNEQGDVVQIFKDPPNLSRPVDVVVDELTGNVLVADASYSHIVVFDRFGKAIKAIGRRGSGAGRFRAITAITIGAEGLYVVDRLELPVQVLTMNGDYKYSFGESYHVFPSAIAVSGEQWVFVADQADNTIRVYQDAELLGVAGGAGNESGRFRTISSMWVSGDKLYVADSLNRRVQVMRILSKTSRPDALTS
ncbi:MAG: 6-bladed beta-propeller [Gammaproteobacteria bacterium]|nr:6-bladed beta-propeller [Gammaproteobacteria bacterium]